MMAPPDRKDGFRRRTRLHRLERHRDGAADRRESLRDTGVVPDVGNEEPLVGEEGESDPCVLSGGVHCGAQRSEVPTVAVSVRIPLSASQSVTNSAPVTRHAPWHRASRGLSAVATSADPRDGEDVHLLSLQFVLGRLAVGDVFDLRDEVQRRTIVVGHDRQRHGDPDDVSVGVEQPPVDATRLDISREQPVEQPLVVVEILRHGDLAPRAVEEIGLAVTDGAGTAPG